MKKTILLLVLILCLPVWGLATVTKIVDPDNGGGTDYTSLDAWEDALGGTTSGDLPSDDQIALAQCRNSSGSADSAPVFIDGWTTDSTRYIKIEAYTGYRHAGVWDSSKYYIESTGGSIDTIETHEDYIRIDGIQITITVSADNSASALYMNIATASNEIRLSNLIVTGSGTGTGNMRGIDLDDTDIIAKIWNCVVYNFISVSDPADGGFRGISCNITTADIWNCTINDCTRGIQRAAGTVNSINCLSFENTDDFTGTITMTYCCSDDDHTGDSGTNLVTTAAPDQSGDDYAALVVDADGRDYNVTDATSKLEGNGTDDPGGAIQDDTDIAGTARSSTWDIGAFELAAVPAVGGQVIIISKAAVPFILVLSVVLIKRRKAA